MIRIVVLGAGLDGLLAAWVFGQHPFAKVTVVGEYDKTRAQDEPPIVYSTSMINVLRVLGIPHSEYRIKEGILLSGQVRSISETWLAMNKEEADRLRHDCYVKATRIPPQESFPIQIPKPRKKIERRIRCDFKELYHTVQQKVRILPRSKWCLKPGLVTTDRGAIPFDQCVVTAPLWEVRERSSISIPEAYAVRRHLLSLIPRTATLYAPWDGILTPYTPEKSIHRLDATGTGGIVAEVTGAIVRPRIIGDLNFLFPDGYAIEKADMNLRGGILPFGESRPKWPNNVVPIGRYSEWNDHLTLDDTVDRAYDLLHKWTKLKEQARI